MQEPNEAKSHVDDGSVGTEPKPATPFGERTDGTGAAAKLVEDMVNGVKGAVDGALAWAERKADELSSEQYSTGPYTSPVTCVPSDFDVIASGILPAMPTQEHSEENNGGQKAAGGGKDGAAVPKL